MGETIKSSPTFPLFGGNICKEEVMVEGLVVGEREGLVVGESGKKTR